MKNQTRLTSEEGIVYKLARHPPLGESDHMSSLHITLLPTTSTAV